MSIAPHFAEGECPPIRLVQPAQGDLQVHAGRVKINLIKALAW